MLEMFAVAQSNQQAGGRTKAKPQSIASQTEQINALMGAITNSNMVDLVASIETLTVVLPTEIRNFVNANMDEVVDGNFSVFGKVSLVVQEGSGEKINLLRNTTLGKFWDAIPDLQDAIAGLDYTWADKSTPTEISGPALQVIPIAIFA